MNTMQSYLKISFFPNIKGKNTEEKTIFSFFDDIKKGTYQQAIETVQAEPDKKKRQVLKQKLLPAITPSGIFAEGHDAINFLVHSGLFCLDFDEMQPATMKLKIYDLKQDKFVFAFFISPSGNGLKVFVKVEPDREKHLIQFENLKKYFASHYDLIADEKCKNHNRLCFVSADKQIFVNKESEVFAVSEPILNTLAPLPSALPDKESEVLRIIAKIKASHADITGDYANWLKIAFCFAEFWGEQGREYFHDISQYHPQYDFNSCNQQYTQALQKNNGKTSINTFFHIAKSNGIDIKLEKNTTAMNVMHQVPTTQKVPTHTVVIHPPTSENPPAHDQDLNLQKEPSKFYQVVMERGIKDIIIDFYQLITILQSMGFCRYDLDEKDNFLFIHIENNIIKEIGITYIQDYFIAWLDKHHQDEEVSLEMLKNKLYKGINTYFSRSVLARLGKGNDLKFLKDTQDKAFFFFKNGIAEVSAQAIKLTPYQEMKGCIWAKQILDREFYLVNEETAKKSTFAQFCNLIAKDDFMNFKSLMTVVGYLLHGFKEGNHKAINFTDSSLESGNNGRTGKTLLAKAIGKLRVYGEINGKDFNFTNKHKYQTLSLDTQLVNLNDVNKGFQLEWIYNDITEGISVERKNEMPFHINANIIVCSNRPLETKGGSDRDRILEFEFAHFFSESYKPKDHFKHLFFTDWDSSQWNEFDNFMLYCAKFYLKVGEMLTPQNTNLEKRKIMEFTSPDFVDFIEGQSLTIGVEYEKKAMFEDFKRFAPDYDNPKFKMNTFTKWLNTYAQNTPAFADIDHYQNKTSGNMVFYLLSEKKQRNK